jgi:hypothetical protein
MKTYFKKNISSFCLDDITQMYTQVNLSDTENVIIKGSNTKVFESLMSISGDSDPLSESEFLQSYNAVLTNISI